MRRQEIASATLEIIGKEGFAALTVARLAAAVGLTSGALFRHFPSREAILGGAARLALYELEATFPEPDLPPLARVQELARRRALLLVARPGIEWLLRSDEAGRRLPPDDRVALGEMARRSRAYLIDALRAGAAGGTIRDDVPPEVLLVVVTGSVHAVASAARRRAGDGDPPPTDRAEAVATGLGRLLANPLNYAGEALPER